MLAGQGTARYLDGGRIKYLPYQRLFKRYRIIRINGLGEYEVYANRDSLQYRESYGLQGIPNLLRGTIRARGYCDSWDALLQLGLTDNSFTLIPAPDWTYSDLLEAYCDEKESGSLKERIARMLGLDPASEAIAKMEWLGLFGNDRIPKLENPTPALVLEELLLRKWALQPADKDMIIMQHEFEYDLDGKSRRLFSTLVMKGADSRDTAMARLVGLPLGIFSRLLLEGKINAPGVHIPVMPEVYKPVLAELAKFGVVFSDKEEVL